MACKTTRRRFMQTTAAAAGGIALPRLAVAAPVPITGPRPKAAAIDYRNDNATFLSDETVELHARYAYSIIGMLPSQSTAAGRQFCVKLKQANPNIKIGQYTILSQMFDSGDTYRALWEAINAGGGPGKDWWARAALNSPVAPGQKTMPQGFEGYRAWSVNQTSFAPADSSGRRWPQRCAEVQHQLTLKPLWDAGVLDFVFNDNVWWHPYQESDGAQPTPTPLPNGACADYKRIGSNNSPTDSALGVSWRNGYIGYWSALNGHMPGVKICANADNDLHTYVSCLSTPELADKADYGFIEALSGKEWSPATFTSMENVLKRYRSQLEGARTTVFVNTYVDSVRDSLGRRLQKARFGLALSMLDDGYACIADQPAAAAMRPFWIDELGVSIGLPADPPPTAPLANGMWMRRYGNGCVVLNPMDNGGRWMNNGGAITLSRSSGGLVTLSRPAGVPQKQPGEKVRIQDCNDSSFNGVFTLSRVTATSLEWSQSGPAVSWTQPKLKGFFATLSYLDLTGQGYRRILGTQDAHNDYFTGGTSQNNGMTVGVLQLWSNDAILLVKG